MVYIDKFGHMAADTTRELEAMTRRLRLPATAQHRHGEALGHVDLTTANAVRRAIAAGAVEIGWREMPEIVRRMNSAAAPPSVGGEMGGGN